MACLILPGSGDWPRRLGAVSRDGREGDAEGDAGFVGGQRVKEGCHPVTLVTRISTSQPKADFEASQREKPANINDFELRNSAENAHFQKLEDWNIRYLEGAALREFDANLTRADTERPAWQDIIADWAELHGIHWQEAAAALIALGLTPPR